MGQLELNIPSGMEQSLVIRFVIEGNLRYVSHRETMSIFQRALVRSGVNICYSSGFNPRCKLSLPLPRSVGVESYDDLLCAIVIGERDDEELRSGISSELPEGCNILSIELLEGRCVFRPEWAVYEFALREGVSECMEDNLQTVRRALGGAGELFVERFGGAGKGVRRKDVSVYIESVECEQNVLTVKCSITPKGSVRVDEILQLLGIEFRDLCVPVKRRSVHWVMN
jgi:radical SAM-linked protein